MTTTYWKATRRFWPRVDKRSPSDCWPWTGGRAEDGRGAFWLEGRNIPASRAVLILSGIEIPPGALVCHTCDNPPCVNPAHLYVGTHRDNVRDMHERGRARVRVPHPASAGERNHNAKLSDAQVDAIRARYTGQRGEQSALAREYGVTPRLVQYIVRGAHR